MNFWKQVPNATKIYMVIMIYLVFLLLGLVILRQSRDPEETSWLSRLFSRKNDPDIASATSSAEANQPTPTYRADQAWLRARTNTRIYEGPGADYPEIAWLENEQTREIVGVSPDGAWWAIELQLFSSGVGWVSNLDVEVNNSLNTAVLGPDGALAVTKTAPASSASAKAVANINIRSGPDLKYQKIGTLEIDQSATILGVSADRFWWLIKAPGSENIKGWVASEYVVAQNAEDVPVVGSESSFVSTLSPGSPYLIAKATLNVRAGPDVTFALIGQLNQGQLAEIIGKTEDGIWWAIRYPGGENDRGWVAAAYSDAQNTNDVPTIK